MAQRLRRHLSFANVTSLIALVFAMGGTSYALTLPKNSVGSKQIRKNAVTSKKVKDRTLRAATSPSGSSRPGRPVLRVRRARQDRAGAPGATGRRVSPGWWARSRCSARTTRSRTTRRPGSPSPAPRGPGRSAVAPRSPRSPPTTFTRRSRVRTARGSPLSTARHSTAGASRTATPPAAPARRPCTRSPSARRTSGRLRPAAYIAMEDRK